MVNLNEIKKNEVFGEYNERIKEVRAPKITGLIGCDFDVGTIHIDNDVIFEGPNDGNTNHAIILHDDADGDSDISVLAAATLDIRGLVRYDP